MPEEQRSRLELLNGVIEERAFARFSHDIIKSNVTELLIRALNRREWRVCPETQFVFGEGSALFPDVAVEVVSSETAERLEDKIHIYFEGGVRSVWVLYPHQRKVFVRTRQGAQMFSQGETLVDGAVGVALRVDEMFEDAQNIDPS